MGEAMMMMKRPRDESPDIESVFAKRINRGLGDVIPRQIQWAPGAAAHFPPRNNHNVPYYKTETVLANAPQIAQFIHRLETQLPYLDDDSATKVVLTKSGRCSKCNCYFVGKGGAKLRDACVVKCSCYAATGGDLEAYCCVQCRVLQWIILGCIDDDDDGNRALLCEARTRPHRGFAQCPRRSCGCVTQTLDDFYKVNVTATTQKLEQGCN
jgi:hypothetical protein